MIKWGHKKEKNRQDLKELQKLIKDD